MKQATKYIIISVLALLPISAAIMAYTASSQLSIHNPNHTECHHSDNGKNRAILNILSVQTPYIVTTQENPINFLVRSVSKNNFSFQYKQVLLCANLNLFVTYKNVRNYLSQLLSQRHSKGHYQYTLCQMRI